MRPCRPLWPGTAVLPHCRRSHCGTTDHHVPDRSVGCATPEPRRTGAEGAAMIEARTADQALRRQDRRRRPDFTVRARHGHRVPRPERRRQVHHDADDPRPGPRRPPGAVTVNGRAVRRACRARCTRSARCWRPRPSTPAASRLQPPAGAGAHPRHPAAPGRRGASSIVGPAAAWPASAPAASPSAWASGSASPPRCSATRRRSCSTSRSTASTPRASCGSATCSTRAGRRGPDRLRLLAPDERDGADRRPPHRHRPRPAARRHHCAGPGAAGGRRHRAWSRSADPAQLRRAPGRARTSTITGQPGSEELRLPAFRPATDRAHRGRARNRAVRTGTVKAVSLEEAFMELTRDAVEYHATTTSARAA